MTGPHTPTRPAAIPQQAGADRAEDVARRFAAGWAGFEQTCRRMDEHLDPPAAGTHDGHKGEPR